MSWYIFLSYLLITLLPTPFDYPRIEPGRAKIVIHHDPSPRRFAVEPTIRLEVSALAKGDYITGRPWGEKDGDPDQRGIIIGKDDNKGIYRVVEPVAKPGESYHVEQHEIKQDGASIIDPGAINPPGKRREVERMQEQIRANT